MLTQIFNTEVLDQSSSERALISTALNLLIKHQDKPISVSQLIKVAGVSRSSFYKYFASKEDLLAAILLTEEMAMSPMLKKMQGYESVAEIMKTYLNYCIQNIEKYKLLVHLERELQSLPEKISRYEKWKLLRSKHVDEFTQIVQSKMSTTNHIDSENIHFYYGLVWSIATGLAHLSESDYFHELIADRRGFSKFLLESISIVGEAK